MVTLQLEATLLLNNFTNYQKMIYKSDATDAITHMLKNDIRIFVIVRSASQEERGKRFECVLKKMKAYGPKFFWVQLGFPFTNLQIVGSCPDSDRAQSLEGSIEFDSTVMDPSMVEQQVGVAGKTLTEMYSQFLLQFPARKADAMPKTIQGFDLRFDSVMSAALALNKTLQFFNYTEDVQLGNSSFKAALFRNIMELDFMGLSGRVVFDSYGDRSSLVMFYQLRNLTRNLVATFDPINKKMNWISDLWFAGGNPPVDEPAVVIAQLLLSKSSTITIVSISAVGIALSMVVTGVNFHFRELRLIKMSSPHVNTVIGVGCLMCYASCIIMALNSYWLVSIGMCWTQAALLTLGYSCAFGAMLAKTWRVHKIFTNVNLRRMAIKDWHLFAVILLVLSFDVAWLVVWASVDPISVMTTYLPEVEASEGTLLRTSIDECTCYNMTLWIAIELGIKGLLLIFAIFFAWETRNVQVQALNDSKQIGVCVYNTTVMGLIGVVIQFVLPQSNKELQVDLIVACIVLCATTTLLLVFGSKIFVLAKHGPTRVDDVGNAMQATAGVRIPER